MKKSVYLWSKWIEKRLHGIVKPEYVNTINDFMDSVRVMIKKGPIKD